MTFAARPAVIQRQSRVTMATIGLFIRYSTVTWGLTNGSATPEVSRNANTGIFCNGGVCNMVGYNAGLDRSYVYVRTETMPGGVSDLNFVKGIIINGTRFAIPNTNYSAPSGAGQWYVSGDPWGLVAASFPVLIEFY